MKSSNSENQQPASQTLQSEDVSPVAT